MTTLFWQNDATPGTARDREAERGGNTQGGWFFSLLAQHTIGYTCIVQTKNNPSPYLVLCNMQPDTAKLFQTLIGVKQKKNKNPVCLLTN